MCVSCCRFRDWCVMSSGAPLMEAGYLLQQCSFPLALKQLVVIVLRGNMNHIPNTPLSPTVSALSHSTLVGPHHNADHNNNNLFLLHAKMFTRPFLDTIKNRHYSHSNDNFENHVSVFQSRKMWIMHFKVAWCNISSGPEL